jgi:hypothetical protein
MLVRRVATFGTVVAGMLAMGVAPLAPSAVAAVGPTVVVSGLTGPLQFAVGRDGTVYADNDFEGTLTAYRGGVARPVASAPSELAGVDAHGRGTVVYTTTTGDENGTTAATLERVLPNGHGRTLADIFGWERDHNPDSVNTYGVQGLSSDCVDIVPPDSGELVPYTGSVDSHAYSVAIVPGGWVVGDAAGNDLVKVGANGRRSTLAVLPPVSTTITADVLTSNEVPEDSPLWDCLLGKTFNSEAVPTDVEMGPDGMLYVSGLSGGIAPGAVYRVNPATGAVTRIGFGFAGATNLAVAPDGSIYVAELFGGEISKLVDGAPQLVAHVDFPAAVEWANGKLYASVKVFAFGSGEEPSPNIGGAQIVAITP